LAEKDSVILRRAWRKWYKPVLDDLYESYERASLFLKPDQAMEEMEEAFRDMLQRVETETVAEASPHARPTRVFRFDDSAFAREAHHYAVDLFYRTYFPRGGIQRKGAPALPKDYLQWILQLKREGMNPAEIAKKLGQPKDRMRKQVEIAEKRFATRTLPKRLSNKRTARLWSRRKK
jgi:hypothetical protein